MALIEIEADEPELLDVKLVGKTYSIRPPKAALTMNMADSFKGGLDEKSMKSSEGLKASKKVIKTLKDWVIQAFAEESKDVFARMNDPKDLLDWPHIMKLMTAVSEATTGDPTT